MNGMTKQARVARGVGVTLDDRRLGAFQAVAGALQEQVAGLSCGLGSLSEILSSPAADLDGMRARFAAAAQAVQNLRTGPEKAILSLAARQGALVAGITPPAAVRKNRKTGGEGPSAPAPAAA